MALPTSISGFSVVPVTYSPSSTHYIYARSHTGSKKSTSTTHNALLSDGRTLFLVNVPPDATDRDLGLLFKHCGTIEKVIFDVDAVEPHHDESDSSDEDEEMDADEEAVQGVQDQPRKRRKVAKDETPKVVPLPSTTGLRTLRTTGRTAHLVFLDASSLERALATASKPRPWPSITPESPTGIAHYSLQYTSLRPPLDAVRTHADTSIAVYEYELAKMKQASRYRKGEAVVDEEGFTLVTRGGAYGKTLGGGVGVASKRFQKSGQTTKRSRGTKEGKEKKDFYAFQKAEKQRSELMNLKKRWEEDKAKVEALKASRRFKPY
ncbi:Ribosomal RNA-processing protein 7 A [Hypsizygus marmoreus]|uniref:Ribosomal RNA-processing protein 7 A n=1 Tax=Hypsizygus marmoreus TaxID=39966 RepID=A0A369JGU8_HYPMA|nr:Ribosomal RNA-processing protein 7 A [Hypsizygus marmoreus]